MPLIQNLFISFGKANFKEIQSPSNNPFFIQIESVQAQITIVYQRISFYELNLTQSSLACAIFRFHEQKSRHRNSKLVNKVTGRWLLFILRWQVNLLWLRLVVFKKKLILLLQKHPSKRAETLHKYFKFSTIFHLWALSSLKEMKGPFQRQSALHIRNGRWFLSGRGLPTWQHSPKLFRECNKNNNNNNKEVSFLTISECSGNIELTLKHTLYITQSMSN